MKTMFTNQLPVLTVGTRVATAAALVDKLSARAERQLLGVAKAGNTNGLRMTQNLCCGRRAMRHRQGGRGFHPPRRLRFRQPQAGSGDAGSLAAVHRCADAVSSAGGAITLTIFPAMIVPGSGAGDDVNINTAHATVTAAPVDGAAVLTFMGAASATLSPRVVIQKQAIVVNTIPLILPASDTAMRRKLTKIPLTVRMWQHSDFYTGAHGVRFDVALNANIRESSADCSRQRQLRAALRSVLRVKVDRPRSDPARGGPFSPGNFVGEGELKCAR
jgi:hypothetical protein